MHVVAVWVEGIDAPFQLQFETENRALDVRDGICQSADYPSLASGLPISDDAGNTFIWRLRKLTAIMTYPA